jgi:type II secretory pathway component PulF
MAQQVRDGLTLHEAGLVSGVLLPWEASLLAVASTHGRLDRALDDLASHYEFATDWWNRLRNRLLLPGAVLLLGWLLLPLPQLAAGQLSVYSYFMQNLLLVATLALIWQRLGKVGRLHRFMDFVLPVPGISKPLWFYHRYRFLHQLAGLYDAGLDITNALQIAIDSCDSDYLRKRWSLITAAVQQGNGVSDALHDYQVLDHTGYALVLGGEASGQLGEMLDHEAQRLEQTVALWLDGIADWLPRISYAVVLLLLFTR